MFTGIVEEKGCVQGIKETKNLNTLVIKARKVIAGTKIGDSISVNGICLTVTKKTATTLTFDLMLETLKTTAFHHLQKGSTVNLERALRVGDRLGGHFVSGHIDGVGKILKVKLLKNYVEFRVSIPRGLKKYLSPKGSVSIDGVSLTVGEVKKDWFSFYLIPHTLEETTLGDYQCGQLVNIETDMLAKYVLARG